MAVSYTHLDVYKRQVLEYTDVRGMNGIKEASVDVNGTTVKVAVVSGLANANQLLTAIKNGTADYQFVEVMACPGGCVNAVSYTHLCLSFFLNRWFRWIK